MGVKPNISYVEIPTGLAARYQYFTEADMRKFNALEMNYQFTSLEDGITDYVKNHLLRADPYL